MYSLNETAHDGTSTVLPCGSHSSEAIRSHRCVSAQSSSSSTYINLASNGILSWNWNSSKERSTLHQEPIAVAGNKRKRDDDDEQIEEGQVFFMSEDGAIVKNRRHAQIDALQREFGTHLPQSFLRPRYKVVHSPLFPYGLKTGPQPYIDFDGKRKIIPRRFDCPTWDTLARTS